MVRNPSIERKIYHIRGEQVMIDIDLAILYRVPTKVFNQAVRRNILRFPADFMFQLTYAEAENLRSQFVTSSWGDRRYLSSYASCSPRIRNWRNAWRNWKEDFRSTMCKSGRSLTRFGHC